MSGQALEGIRVLDLSQLVAGPYCTKLLASYGADVIKVEKPAVGDIARRTGPFLHDEPGPEMSGLFLYLNCNKKSVTLNLKSQTGVRIFKDLVKNADLVVGSYRPGTMDRFGLGYDVLEKINPKLVMTSVSNFGQDGPYRDYKSSHLIAWGMSGGRYNNGRPGEQPIQGGFWLTDYVTGLHAASGTAVALYAARDTGIGQQVDTSILESEIMSTQYVATNYHVKGVLHNDGSKSYLGIVPCKDGYIGLNVYQMQHWEMMCLFFGKPELIEDPRFKSLIDIKHHDAEARAIFAPLVKDRPKMELFEAAREWKMTWGLVPNTAEILESPQHQSRDFIIEVEHPDMGRVTMPGAPFKMMGTPFRIHSPAPRLGEHNEAIYCGRLGYSKDDLVRMREQGTI